ARPAAHPPARRAGPGPGGDPFPAEKNRPQVCRGRCPRVGRPRLERELRYFTCSARNFAALAWASERPCLPAACEASASFESALASSIMPALRAFWRSSPVPAFGSAAAIASLAALTRVGELKAQAEPTVSPTTSASENATQVRMACLLIGVNVDGAVASPGERPAVWQGSRGAATRGDLAV